MGIGMIVVANRKYAKSIVNFLDKKGFKSYIIGKAVKAKKKKIVLL
jgi:phosphoribosylaminoimidazole (AIR) synthetase